MSKSPLIMKYGVNIEVLIAEGPDGTATWTTSAIKVTGQKGELGEEGVRRKEGRAGKERYKGLVGVGERENNERIINPNSHLYKMYVFYRLSGETKDCSETAFSVTLESKVLSHTRRKKL